MKKATFALLVVFSFFVLADDVFCHPHVFIDAELVFVFDDRGLSGVRERWVFDEMFSQDLLVDFDSDEDGRLNVEDISRLRDIFYENTKEYNYFNIITIDGRKHSIDRLKDFTVSIESDCIVYEFFVPCSVPAGLAEDRKVKVLLFDETIYTHLSIADYRVDMKNKPGAFSVKIKYEMLDEVVTPLGSLVPDSVVITFRKK
ncbi:MAG: DUF1007 family protein [Deltaproteobacteria bacterium]|uniref:DUF1007 family protein n=1 Tax=Candidatus Zymogenus saltonus TaxID=2844893 RepID=A0A9D8PPU7_9DELT|nr:DUF1007 family protein [Candidatus Zymogenus saltonus]